MEIGKMEKLREFHAAESGNFDQVATNALIQLIEKAIQQDGRCTIGLSGGSTPKPIYTLLGQQTSINWDVVHFFLVDERYISIESPLSNTNMIKNTLLKSGNVKEAQFVYPNTDLPIIECIKDYERKLNELIEKNGTENKKVHVVTLGIGPDGHIASLFPPVNIDESIGEGRILQTQTERFDVKDRISISLPRITSASSQVFFMKGAEKLQMLKEMSSDQQNYSRWPAMSVVSSGNSVFVTDFQLPAQL